MRYCLLILCLFAISAACVSSNSNVELKQTIQPTISPCISGITSTPSTPYNEVYNYFPSPKLSAVNRSLLPHIIPDPKMKGRTEEQLNFSDALIYDSNNNSSIFVQNVPFSIYISINNSVYYGAKTSSKNLINFPEISDDDNFNLSYNAMIDDPFQNEMYSDLIHDLRRYKEMNHFDDNEYLEFITRFVQSIPYNETNAHKFPIEVVFENSGVCDDKSKLLAGILEREGYDVSLFIVHLKNPIGKYENHMFVGVKSNGILYNGTNYTIIETTTNDYPFYTVEYHYIGSSNLANLKPQVTIIKVGNGTKMYTKTDEVLFIEEGERKIKDELNYKLNCPSNESPSIETLTTLNAFFELIAPNRNSTYIWFKNQNDLQLIPDRIVPCNSSISSYQKICN